LIADRGNLKEVLMRSRHELTDEQWLRIEPLLPGRAGDGGRVGKDNRLFVNAVLFVAKTGVPWRDLPERFGKWNSVWRRFDRWCASGVWVKLASILGDEELEELQLDSTSIKAQHSAAGSRLKTREKKSKPTSDAASGARAADGRRRSTRR
jgi:transposase